MASESFSEKVSVNINSSTLSSIDLLVDNGYYSNRSDFINQALRSALQQNQSTLDRIIHQNTKMTDPWFVGVYSISARDLEQYLAQGQHIRIRGYGVLMLGPECSEELVFSVIDAIQVKGRVHCSQAIKTHYGLT